MINPWQGGSCSGKITAVKRMGLAMHEKVMLIDCARSAVVDFLVKGMLDDTPELCPDPPAPLLEKRGIFVSVLNSGKLRGCMGTVAAVLPSWMACRVSARNAVYKDPRFMPLSREELPHISFEIAIMGTPRPFVDISQIRRGSSGLILQKGSRQEVYLPGMLGNAPGEREALKRYLRDEVNIDAEGIDAPETWMVFDVEVIREGDL